MNGNVWSRAGACMGAIALAGCANPHWTPASAADEKDVVVMRVYEGPVKPPSQVATVFAFDGNETGDAQWICSVDGKELQRTVGLSVHCPSVVYLLPGRHVLGWRYHGRRSAGDATYVVGSSELSVDVEAGHTYDLIADGKSRTTKLAPRYGYAVRFSDIRPGFSNAEIPN